MLTYYFEKTFFGQYSKLYIAICDVFQVLAGGKCCPTHVIIILHMVLVVVHNYTRLNVIITEFVVSAYTSR